MRIQEAIQSVTSGNHLTRGQAYEVMNSIMEGEATPAQIGAFLIAEKMKGETFQEVAGFAAAMREKATPVRVTAGNAIDIVGTGGDGANTFNISTVAAFVIAACGVPVAKHGNRSVSSKCGSADVLELLGVRVDLEADAVAECVNAVGIGFLFAPMLHKAMKHALGPRKEIGVRTFFNILGPLTNPAGVKRQLTGVFDAGVAELMANVFHELGAEHVLVVHSDDGLDEISVYAPTQMFEVTPAGVERWVLTPAELGLPTAKSEGALGGTPEENAETARAILKGSTGVERDFVVANAAGGLYVSGHGRSLAECAELAREAIDSGAAYEKLQQLQELSARLAP